MITSPWLPVDSVVQVGQHWDLDRNRGGATGLYWEMWELELLDGNHGMPGHQLAGPAAVEACRRCCMAAAGQAGARPPVSRDSPRG